MVELSPQESVDLIVRLRQEGKSIKEIAAITGRPCGTVSGILRDKGVKASAQVRRANLQKSHPRVYPPELDDLICSMVSEGILHKTIAQKVNVPVSFVELVIKRRNPPRPDTRAKNVWSGRVRSLLLSASADTMTDIMQQRAVANGGNCLGLYVDAHTHIEWKCAKGHVFPMTPNKVQQGQWCPHCARVGPSKAQIEIFEYVKSLLPHDEILLSDRTIIKPLELDIYVPSKYFAIEYDGLLHHSSFCETDDRPYNRLRHSKKFTACSENGVRLFAIYEDEWLTNLNLIKAMISWRLKVFTGTKLNARDLELRKLNSNSQFRDFFERNHIDGHANASFSYGLFNDDKLVMCASVRRNFAGETELARLATDYDYSVRGGGARLIAAIRKEINGPLTSYSNNRLSSGSIYGKLGFQKIRDIGPSYWYTDGRTRRIQRFNCRRNNDPAIIAEYPTEKAQALGGVFSQKYFGDSRPLYQIHDYGHIKWRLN